MPAVEGKANQKDAHPLVSTAYARWKHLPWKQVIDEMAVLFHLAVKLDKVKSLEAELWD